MTDIERDADGHPLAYCIDGCGTPVTDADDVPLGVTANGILVAEMRCAACREARASRWN